MNRTGRIFFVGLTVLTMACGSTAQAQVGTWKDYMAYYDVQDVKKGGSVLYVLASDNLYSYNEGDGSIQTYDKVNGLSDCGIAKIEWNRSVGKLIIVYSDYNIDMLDAKGNITNLSDFYSATISGDKTVYNIYMSGRFAYLSTGFGIVKVNMRDNEISDTYNLKFRVDYCYIDGNYIYAASSTNGLYRAALSDNLLDPGKWSRVGAYTPRSYTVDADLLATARSHRPDGPKANNFYSMRFKYGNLYTVGGRYNQTGDSQMPGTVQVLNPKDGEWTVYEDSIQDKSGHSYIDALCIDVDPTDHSHVMVGARTGLYEFRNGRYVRDWYCQNSDIQQAVGGSVNYTLVTSGAFDGSGNFWFANSQSTSQSLWEYTADGKMVSHHKDQYMDTNHKFSFAHVHSMMFDKDDLLWFVSDYWATPYLVCYQPSTDATNVYKNYVNEDGTAVTVGGGARCVAEDLNGNIWVGTNAGPLFINAEDKTLSPDKILFQQYKVPRNDGTNLADYLLSGVDVMCMAIDGGNRKWFGTNGNGVYLISADNNTQIHHFLSTNSGLLSDNVQSIAINPKTGEVFFGTDNGLCSYMSDATATVDKMDKNNTYAYPNPVKPGYNGPITITGLSYNADVKIVTSNGALVAQGRSNGGSFVWYGTDLDGKRVASGVYMVMTATESGDKGTVCKIVVVN